MCLLIGGFLLDNVRHVDQNNNHNLKILLKISLNILKSVKNININFKQINKTCNITQIYIYWQLLLLHLHRLVLPKPLIYVSQSSQGHLDGFHFLIKILNLLNVSSPWIFLGN